ncbi:MAG: mycofactocin biosynthesis peptidyl-dipeptidase MftE [Acidimicrobiia bacterium]|nr:mycofactocin biosynthesis peptidyl-dipeptidase MftE [Acidimicrobiia bacterium]
MSDAGAPALGGGGKGNGDQRVGCLLVPLGATEQHGPHLPLTTDTIIATAWATAAASQVDGAAVAPSLPYGSSGEHQDFPGTLSIGRDALERVIIELVRSAAHFCDRVVLVSGHGGNVPVLAPTVTRLNAEGHKVSWVSPRWPSGTGVDAHAGHTETSLLLHLRPDLVGPFDDVSGNTEPLSVLLPLLRTDGLAAVSSSGVLGDPRGATAEDGAALFEHLVESLVEHLLSVP